MASSEYSVKVQLSNGASGETRFTFDRGTEVKIINQRIDTVLKGTAFLDVLLDNGDEVRVRASDVYTYAVTGEWFD